MNTQDMIEKLRSTLVVVPKPGTGPLPGKLPDWEPDYIPPGARAGEYAGLRRLCIGGNVFEHIYAVDPFAAEVADALERQAAGIAAMRDELETINMLACYASEENTDARETALLEIGKRARAALAAQSTTATLEDLPDQLLDVHAIADARDYYRDLCFAANELLNKAPIHSYGKRYEDWKKNIADWREKFAATPGALALKCEASQEASRPPGLPPDGWCPVCGGQNGQHKPGCEDGSERL